MDIWKKRFEKIDIKCTNKVAHFKIGYKNDIKSKNKVIDLVKTYDFLRRSIISQITRDKYGKKDYISNLWRRLSKKIMDFTISHYQIYDYVAPEFDYAAKINKIMKELTDTLTQLTNSNYYQNTAKTIISKIKNLNEAEKKPNYNTSNETFMMIQSNFTVEATNMKYRLCQSMLLELGHIFKTVYKKYKISNNKIVRSKIKLLIKDIEKFILKHSYYHDPKSIKKQILTRLKYDKSKFSALRYKCSIPINPRVTINTTMLLFDSGSMVNPGIKIQINEAAINSQTGPEKESIAKDQKIDQNPDSYMDIFYRKFVDFMAENKLFKTPVTNLGYIWRIVNTSYCFQLPFYSQKYGDKYVLNLTDLTAPSKYSQHIWYDPCMFPGETIAIPGRREKFILYSSRKCILSGCKKKCDTTQCMEYLIDIFREVNPVVKDLPETNKKSAKIQ